MLEFILTGKQIDKSSDQQQAIAQALNTLNTDAVFLDLYKRLNRQLKKVNWSLRHDCKDLWMRRPLLNLHTLYQQAEKADRQDLEAVRQYLESHEE